jgi:hypothetical protein
MITKLQSILQAEGLEHLLPIFSDQGVTDSILGDLSADDLRDLGIEKLGERKRLLSAFAGEIAPVATDKLENEVPLATRQEDFTYEAANGEITITGFRGKGHVVIPDKFDDLPLPVRHIGPRAFQDNGMILSIRIPEGVTSIGDFAFSGCSSLTRVTIPSSLLDLTNINIPSIIEINVSDEHESYSSIDGVVFDKGKRFIVLVPKGLTSYEIPDGVEVIGEKAFYDCKKLTSVKIHNSVKSIGDNAFGQCVNLESIEIPISVTSIGRGAFYFCTSLTSVTIPNKVTSIESIFFCCTGLTNVLIPDSVKHIGENAFAECISLSGVSIPNSVASIGNQAFYNCISLTEITIPESVKTIGESAFSSCENLQNVMILNSDTKISEYAFYRGCYELARNPGSIQIGNGLFILREEEDGGFVLSSMEDSKSTKSKKPKKGFLSLFFRETPPV